MYYDRTLNPRALSLLTPGGPLEWLPGWTRSEAGRACLADVQFRRAGARGASVITVYAGTSSALSFTLGGGACRLGSDDAYESIAPEIFARPYEVEALRESASTLKTYLELAAEISRRDGESASHSLLMRRWGLDAAPHGLWQAFDREVRIGYEDAAERAALDLRGPKFKRRAPARELDAIGLLADGAVALVEVKRPGGDLCDAVQQLLTHAWRFGELDQAANSWRTTFAMLGEQKAKAGLLPLEPRAAPTGPLVPILVAADHRSDWAPLWRATLSELKAQHRLAFERLRLWRIDEDGGIEEARA